ncbi:MAG: T9SS type A sorting domain-containing protein [Bacteroidetes bacterium]|nr:T9SS type A sorting domain-containing protein [Bacteroidota bacterium]
MKKVIFFISIFIISVVNCKAQFPPTTPTNYPITTAFQTGESSVYISPNNPRNIIVGLNSYSSGNPSIGVFISTDAGYTWTANPTPLINGLSHGDPSVSINRNGKFFISYYGFGNYQYVSRSSNGNNWSNTVLSTDQTDKNFIYIDNNCSSPHFNRIYNAWTVLNTSQIGAIFLRYSDDEGESWSSPQIQIYPPAPEEAEEIAELPIDPTTYLGVNLVSDDNGILICSWCEIPPNINGVRQPRKIGVSRSSDGGDNWELCVSNITPNSYYIDKEYNCIGPSLCYNTSNNYAYLVFSSNNAGFSYDNNLVYIARSSYPYTAWTQGQVNNAATNQVYPTIAFDEYSNTMGCVYYNKFDGTFYKTYVSLTTDGGTAWSHNPVSQSSFTNLSTSLIRNDYIGLSMSRGYVVPVWTQLESGNYHSYAAPFTLTNADFDIPNTALTQNTTYKAANSIFNSASLNNVSLSSYSLTLTAGNYIQLNPGFDVVASGSNTFSATIPFCTVSSTDNLSFINGNEKTVPVVNNKIENSVSEINFYLKSYPNPFNPTTTIEYGIPTDGNFKIIIYDILGREVKTLLNDFVLKGKYTVQFSNEGLNSGIYYCKISSLNYNKTIKLLNIK